MLNIIRFIKEKIFFHSLSSKKGNRISKYDFISWDMVKTIALINQGGSDIHHWEEQLKVYEQLKKMGKQVYMYTYCNEKTVPNHLKDLHQKIITKKEVNWCGIPTQEVQKDIINQHFDIIIDLTKVAKRTTIYLLTIADVHMRIGKNDQHFQPYFDLLIDWKNDESVQDFMEHILYYLQIIKQPKK